jgi:hypothetical protein
MGETMNSISQYREPVAEAIHKISERERESLSKAADLLADKIAEDRLIYVIGSGDHSQNRQKSCSGEPVAWPLSSRFWRVDSI